MKDNLKINIVAVPDKPCYHEVIVNYRPVGLNGLTEEQKNEVVGCLIDTLKKLSIDVKMTELNNSISERILDEYLNDMDRQEARLNKTRVNREQSNNCDSSTGDLNRSDNIKNFYINKVLYP